MNNFCHNNQIDIRYVNLLPFVCSTVETEGIICREYLPVMSAEAS